MRLRSLPLLLVLVAVSSALAGWAVVSFFREPELYRTGQEPLDVVAADVNGDGHLDVLTANREGRSISIFLGDGTGALERREPFSLGELGGTSLAVADMNGDGASDVVVSTCVPDCQQASILVLHGAGDGSFTAGPTISTSGIPYNVAVADLDLDGRPDVAASDYPGGRLMLFLSGGHPERFTEMFLPTGARPVALRLADLDDDGFPDLVSADQAGGGSSVYLNHGGGEFSERIEIPTGDLPYSIALANLDGDRLPDLAVAHSTDPGRVSVLQGRGDGTFALRQDWEVFGRPIFIHAADFDGDGHADLAITRHGDSRAGVFLNEGDGLFDDREIGVPARSDIYSLAVADLDGDTHPDLVAVDFEQHTLSVALGSGL